MLLGVFFDILSGVLGHRKPVEWRPRMSDYWGELASALYEHMGWGRDTFTFDHEQVEVKQHDVALDPILGTSIMDYLYDECDDGKKELIKPKKDLCGSRLRRTSTWTAAGGSRRAPCTSVRSSIGSSRRWPTKASGWIGGT